MLAGISDLDPLLVCIKEGPRLGGQALVRDDKTDTRKQLAGMVLDLGDDPSRLRPALCLVRGAFVAHQWPADGPSWGPEEDFSNLIWEMWDRWATCLTPFTNL